MQVIVDLSKNTCFISRCFSKITCFFPFLTPNNFVMCFFALFLKKCGICDIDKNKFLLWVALKLLNFIAIPLLLKKEIESFILLEIENMMETTDLHGNPSRERGELNFLVVPTTNNLGDFISLTLKK